MKTANKYTGVWKYCSVYKILRCLSKNRLCTKMLIIHLFSIFTIKTSRALAALAPYRPLNHEDTDKCTVTVTCVFSVYTTYPDSFLEVTILLQNSPLYHYNINVVMEIKILSV